MTEHPARLAHTTALTTAQTAAQAAAALRSAGASDPQDAPLEAELLLRRALRCDRAQYFANLNAPIAPQPRRAFQRLLDRRLSGEPIAHIIGRREFYGLEFAVTPDVLVPRQETELIVDMALAHARASGVASPKIADVGAGSGAIAIAIARNLPSARICASDISGAALAVADRNRRRHGVAARVSLARADLLTPFRGGFDIIASNPPYIDSALMARLPPDVQREPPIALDGGPRGVALIKRLLSQAAARLNPGGCVLVEISPDQAAEVSAFARQRIPDAQVAVAPDPSGAPRCVSAVRR